MVREEERGVDEKYWKRSFFWIFAVEGDTPSGLSYGSSKMQTAPVSKSSTVLNYGDISHIFIFIFGHT
jgi:hypothetical protein